MGSDYFPLEAIARALEIMESDLLTGIQNNVRKIHQVKSLVQIIRTEGFKTRFPEGLTNDEIFDMVKKFDMVYGSELMDKYLIEVMEDEFS
jgi:hypothetical protein